MRIDKFLKNSRVIKRRQVAKEACDGGRVSINGRVAKPGAEVQPADIVEIRFGGELVRFEVLSVPEHVRKEDADSMYRLLEGGEG
ncbi:MAG: RNA-binding S4 domain-containing protein [Ndongobacter sp.]|nr:RNA-binding S4 domain-containing protein [Ndongobacter sp.]